jgi:hypothetical protein
MVISAIVVAIELWLFESQELGVVEGEHEK